MDLYSTAGRHKGALVRKQSYTVRHVERAYSGFLKLDIYDATVTQDGHSVEMRREVHDHGHGATVLPYDEARRTCLLIRQFRLPIHVVEGDGIYLETAAGLTDETDSGPEETAAREGREELGYAIHDLSLVAKVYTIPGLVTEQMSCFLARYSPADKLDDRDLDEDEIIDVEEWGLDEAWRALEAGEITDVKAVVCLQGLRVRRPELFSPLPATASV